MDHLEIINKLKENNHQAFIVGGILRDELLGIESRDIDIATSAYPLQICEIFKNSKPLLVGESFGVVLIDSYDVATFRSDRYNGLDHKDCKVSFVDTIEEDLARRDFTINALARDGEKIIDPFNGAEDCKNRIIRFVGNPQDRINEDPDRIIRACRFLAKIEGEFEKNTFSALKNNARLIQYIAPERIKIEILKALNIKNASMFFEALHNIGCLEYIFPRLKDTCHHNHGKFHRETVWDHCMVVGDCISTKYPLIKLAGYLHDIAKPTCYIEDSFIDHEIIGASFIEEDLKFLKFSNVEITFVVGLITNHMRSITTDFSYKSARKAIKSLSFYNCSYKNFLRLKIADRQGNLFKEPYSISLLKDTIKKFQDNRDMPLSTHDLAISGKEIIDLLGIQPGPLIGQIQRKLLTFVIETGINDKDVLIQEIKKNMED